MRFILFSSLLLNFTVFSQNLIKNPSFEITNTNCIRTISRIRDVKNWETANFGTTDVFSTCANNHVGVPNNYNGFQKPKDGNNYVGCYFYTKDNRNYREYIQGELNTTLVKDKKYKVSFFISLADASDYAIKNLAFYFSNRNVVAGTSKNIIIDKLTRYRNFILHFYNIENDSFYTNKNNWIKIEKTIVAKGYENYITIGNFENDKKIEKIKIKRKDQKIAYYYIDLVSIIEIEGQTKINNIVTDTIPTKEIVLKSIKKKTAPKKYTLNKIYIFKNVNFAFNSATLQEKAKLEIEKIYPILEKSPSTNIIISGHTDNIGNINFNQKLSELRANAVMQYFIKLGLNPSRIIAIGYGKIKPLTNNTSEKDREKNRRVEFKLIQN